MIAASEDINTAKAEMCSKYLIHKTHSCQPPFSYFSNRRRLRVHEKIDGVKFYDSVH